MTIFENRTETLREEASGVKVIRRHDGQWKIKMSRAIPLKTKGKL
jgi:hypothetical protein